MSFKETFAGRIVQDGARKRLKISSPAYFSDKLLKIPEGKKVWVTVDDRAPKRSEQQNRFYWMYLNNISDETGNETEDLHTHFKSQYLRLPQAVLTVNGVDVVVQKYRSTTDLSKAEFSEYMQKIERDTGVPIPDAEEWVYGKREEQIEIYNKLQEEYPDPVDFKEPTI